LVSEAKEVRFKATFKGSYGSRSSDSLQALRFNEFCGKKDKNHDLLNRPALLLITAANYHVGTLSVMLTPIVSFLLSIDSIFHADETEYQHDRVPDL